MKAVVCTRYGPPDVLRLAEVETPAPRRGEVRIRVRATAVTSSDCIIRGFKIAGAMWLPARLVLGMTKPRRSVLGMVVSGAVERIGDGVTEFKEGDEVFALDPFRGGAYAEYKCMRANGAIARRPTKLSFEESAAIPYGGLLALHFLRAGGMRDGIDVLVYGASGAVGTSAVQLAKHFGGRVTGVCSAVNAALVESLGADATIDYTKSDITQQKATYDLVLVAVGSRVHPPSRSACRGLLSTGGSYVGVDGGRPKLRAEDLDLLKDLVEAGKLRPVIDRVYPLDRLAEAHAYVDAGHKKGNVVVTVP